MRGTALTARQREALEVIRAHLSEHKVPPSRLELATGMKLPNPSAVDRHLNALVRKGWVHVMPGVDRGIRLLREGTPILDPDDLPAITAGSPTVIEERFDVPRVHDLDSVTRQFEAAPDYFLRVTGDSLDKVGFHSGDIVAVRRQPEARNGDIVVARIGQEVTLKRYERVNAHRVELQPVSSNPEHEAIPIGPTPDDAEIVGIVVGAIVGTRRGPESLDD